MRIVKIEVWTGEKYCSICWNQDLNPGLGNHPQKLQVLSGPKENEGEDVLWKGSDSGQAQMINRNKAGVGDG